MITRRDLIVGLAVFCIAATLFSAIPAIGQTGEYDPWLDINDDGYVGIDDIFTVASHFGSEGTPIAKATLQHDSGWISIADKCGQNIAITHNLNSADIMVDITGKTTPDGGAHQRHLGGIGYPPEWSRTYGGLYTDGAESIVCTSDAGYAIIGTTHSFGAGAFDVWLIKTDKSGSVQWNKTYGGIDWEYEPSIVQTSDGGYAVAASTNSSGAGDFDFWLFKVDASGNMQWNKTYGGASYDRVLSLVLTSDGGYALAGHTNSFAVGYDDYWLVKTDSAGNMQWNKTYGYWSAEYARSLVQTSDGGYAIAGYTYSIGAGGSDSWLVKTDASGNMQWNATYGVVDYDYGECVIQTEDEGYAIASWTLCFDGGQNDSRLVKIDAEGNIQWNATFGEDSSDDRVWDLVKSDDSGYAIAGATQSLGAGGWDFWLVRINANGSILWNKAYGGIGLDMAFSLIQTGDRGYMLAGVTTSQGAGDNDFWLVKTDAAGNIEQGDWFAYGLAWTDSTANSITLYRGITDAYWNFVRVRIWKVKETP
jgi:predicted secreted protein